MDGFTNVGSVDDFRIGRGRAVRLGDVEVAVFRTRNGWFALQDACPHMGASLADGKFDDSTVECHWHHWRFELASGQSDQRSWCKAAVYDVRIHERAVWLRPPAAPEPRPEPQETQQPQDDEWIRWDPDRFFKKKKKK